MTCPRCKAPFTRLVESRQINGRINLFGRRELTFEATHENPVTWQGNHYHCSDCGLDFSLKEHTTQLLSNTEGTK